MWMVSEEQASLWFSPSRCHGDHTHCMPSAMFRPMKNPRPVQVSCRRRKMLGSIAGRDTLRLVQHTIGGSHSVEWVHTEWDDNCDPQTWAERTKWRDGRCGSECRGNHRCSVVMEFSPNLVCFGYDIRRHPLTCSLLRCTASHGAQLTDNSPCQKMVGLGFGSTATIATEERDRNEWSKTLHTRVSCVLDDLRSMH